MNNKFILLLVLVFSQLCYSQSTNTWLEHGSDWHYATWYFASNQPIGYNHYYYAQDTLIGNKAFQQVKIEQQLRTIDFNGNYILGDTTFFPSKYFFTSNDTVYVLSANNTLQFVWFNNPAVGDIWDFGLQYDQIYNNFKHVFSQVDSVVFININGQILKEIYSHSCKDIFGTPIQLGDSALFVNHISRINTKFGPVIGFNGINTYESATVTDGFIADNLLCFQSDSFSFYQTGLDDCNNGILTDDKVIIHKDKIDAFPNPALNIIYIDGLSNNSEVCIYNQIGQLQQTDTSLDKSIDISDLGKGLYFYIITDKKKQIKTTGKFIKE